MSKKMSKKFNMIKIAYQDHKTWTKKMVKDAVLKGYITSEEYEIIVDETYEP